MKSRLLAATFAVTAVAFTGCGGGGEAVSDDGPGIRGVLRDERGTALADSEVLACMATVCQFGVTDAEGHFVFEIDPPAEVAIKTRPDPSAEPPRGSALYPVQLVEASTVDLRDVHVPNLPSGEPLADDKDEIQTVDAGDGVQLALRRGDLVAGGHAIETVAARAIPSARTPPLPELSGEEIVAVFALHPFGVTSRSPIAVEVATALPAGTAVNIRTISEINGRMSEPLLGTSDGSHITTAAGSGIHEITWLVITRRA